MQPKGTRADAVRSRQPDNPCQTESHVSYSKHSTAPSPARQLFWGLVTLEPGHFAPSHQSPFTNRYSRFLIDSRLASLPHPLSSRPETGAVGVHWWDTRRETCCG